ncbi:MAG: hypothetical protein J6K92_12435 [Oscillospiraceae bacterium]|nr:hypothetical protein [Oscillospiraceae bacterium]
MRTMDEIKAELKKARQAQKAYRLAKDKFNALRQDLIGGKSVRYGSDGSVHESRGNPVENAYCMLADYETEKDKQLLEMMRAHKRAESMIRSVPDPIQREVLTRRYIIGQEWEDIAYVMNYNLRHVYKIHGAALHTMALNGTISL